MGRSREHQRPIKRRTVGQLRPECIYNADGLMRFLGIGEKTLKRMRQEGVKPRPIGPRMFYRGRDVIDWILQQDASPEVEGETT